MKKIYKFELSAPSCAVKMPAGAEVLSVREQCGSICLWAKVDPTAPAEVRHFAGYGTGHSIPDVPLRFLGTAHLQGGALVFHIFEVLAAAASGGGREGGL